jgi:hypothetical protein
MSLTFWYQCLPVVVMLRAYNYSFGPNFVHPREYTKASKLW